MVKNIFNKTDVINDPLGQTHSPPAGSDHHFHLKIILFLEILKSGNGRMDMGENSDHYRQVDQF